MSSSPQHDDSSRPMPTRLLSSLKRPFSRPKNDHDRYPSFSPERTRGPIHSEAPPNCQQIAMGLHLSRTPHFPAHLAHLYPPTPPARLHRSNSSPSSSIPSPPPPSRTRRNSRSHSPASTHPPRPSRLLPPPQRSALKKPRAKATATTTASSSVTPDTASASTVASSVLPQTPTRSFAREGSGGLLARFLGKERAAAAAARTLVVLADEAVREPERKAVRFGGLKEEEDES